MINNKITRQIKIGNPLNPYSQGINFHSVYKGTTKVWPVESDWPWPYYPPCPDLYDLLNGPRFVFGFFQLAGYEISGVTYEEGDMEGEGGSNKLRVVQYNRTEKVYDVNLGGDGTVTVPSSNEDRWTFLICEAWEFYLQQPGNIFNQWSPTVNPQHIAGLLVKQDNAVGHFMEFSTDFSKWFLSRKEGWMNYEGVDFCGILGTGNGESNFNTLNPLIARSVRGSFTMDKTVPYYRQMAVWDDSGFEFFARNSFGATVRLANADTYYLNWDIVQQYNLTLTDWDGNPITEDKTYKPS